MKFSLSIRCFFFNSVILLLEHSAIAISKFDFEHRDLELFFRSVIFVFFYQRYKGTYCSQEVAIKVLKPDLVNKDMLREFAQEVFIMRKIWRTNVVQFMGTCTRTPNLCILTGGSRNIRSICSDDASTCSLY